MGVGGQRTLAAPYCEGTLASVGQLGGEPLAFEASLHTDPEKHIKCGHMT